MRLHSSIGVVDIWTSAGTSSKYQCLFHALDNQGYPGIKAPQQISVKAKSVSFSYFNADNHPGSKKIHFDMTLISDSSTIINSLSLDHSFTLDHPFISRTSVYSWIPLTLEQPFIPGSYQIPGMVGSYDQIQVSLVIVE